MSLRDVLEYRASDSSTIVFDVEDLPVESFAGTIYARPFGADQWGYHSGGMYWDDEYRRSHEAVSS